MFGALAPYAIPAGLSLAQGLVGKQQAKRDQERMKEQEKQNLLTVYENILFLLMLGTIVLGVVINV